MKKQWTLPLAALALASGCATYFFMFGPLRYEKYEGLTAVPGVRFDYPKGWTIREDSGRLERYSQVLALGPRPPVSSMRSAFVVRQIPQNGRFENLETLKRNRLEHLYKNPVVVSDAPTQLSGLPAQAVVATYTSLPPVDGRGPSAPTDVKTKMIFAERNGAFYEIIFMAEQREFGKYAAYFEHLLDSFRFPA